MNAFYDIRGWETIKVITKERYFVNDDNFVQERLNVYQNQLFDKKELYAIDSNHVAVLEYNEKTVMNPITFETINYPQFKITKLDKY